MTQWRMMTCYYCGRDLGGLAGIFEARDRGEEIERYKGPEMGSCPCDENPWTPQFEPGETVGKMVRKPVLTIKRVGKL